MGEKLTENQREALGNLESFNHGPYGKLWATTMECGGFNGSHHSGSLAALARKGFVERKQRWASEEMIGKGPRECGMSRGSWEYRITPAGRAALSREEGR